MKNYVILRSYENALGVTNFGVVYGHKPQVNMIRGKYEISYAYDELLDYEELSKILKENGYELSKFVENNKIKDELLNLIFDDENLKYKLHIVEVSKELRDLYYGDPKNQNAGENSDYYNSLKKIQNDVYKLKLKRIN